MRFAVKLLSLLLFAGAVQSADPAPEKAVMACMRANVPETIRIQEVDLLSVDRDGGERLLKGRMFGTREDGRLRVMFRVEAPADLAGAAYLMREEQGRDDMFLYLPAINKVRRIRGGSADGKLFGSDLSYNDIKQIQNVYSSVSVRFDGEQTLDGRQVSALSLQPLTDNSRYERLQIKVDKLTCIAMLAEFLEGGTVSKRLTVPAAKLRQVGKYWFAEEVHVVDLKEGTRTRLKVTDVRSDTDLSSRYFNTHSFYLGG